MSTRNIFIFIIFCTMGCWMIFDTTVPSVLNRKKKQFFGVVNPRIYFIYYFLRRTVSDKCAILCYWTTLWPFFKVKNGWFYLNFHSKTKKVYVCRFSMTVPYGRHTVVYGPMDTIVPDFRNRRNSQSSRDFPSKRAILCAFFTGRSLWETLWDRRTDGQSTARPVGLNIYVDLVLWRP
jgi:hypothetical protein